ncbi:MAG: hypothetical protein E7374_03245 [Clostridiales bacterium]|nr:hypothetical protein [Clostridiales bacterium]
MKFELNGYGVENLIKTLHSKKIKIFNLTYEEKKVTFEVMDKDEKKVKRYIGNFKVKKTFTNFKALPKFLLANVGVVIGLFLGIICLIFASTFTWDIRIYGTKDLKVNEILNVLEENGVKRGRINTETKEDIENILLEKYDRIAQVSVMKKGTTILINLSEKLVYDEEEFLPITAKFSGIVTSVNVVTGTLNVKVGDYVNEGDLLVLPFNINKNGEKVNVCPKAEIYGEIFLTEKKELKRKETVLVRTGKKIVTYDYFFKKKKLFSRKVKNSFALFETNMYNENISNVVPLNRNKIVTYELKTEEITHNFDEEKENLINECEETAKEKARDNEILSTTTSTFVYNDTMYAVTILKIKGLIND